MKGYGDPMQYSVFLCDLDPSERVVMRGELRRIMNEREDSVAIVDLGDPAGKGLECFEFLGVTMRLPHGGPRIV
jgi:CRISPR-associated protein Cas2